MKNLWIIIELKHCFDDLLLYMYIISYVGINYIYFSLKRLDFLEKHLNKIISWRFFLFFIFEQEKLDSLIIKVF